MPCFPTIRVGRAEDDEYGAGNEYQADLIGILRVPTQAVYKLYQPLTQLYR